MSNESSFCADSPDLGGARKSASMVLRTRYISIVVYKPIAIADVEID
jgi:hypothetical protein